MERQEGTLLEWSPQRPSMRASVRTTHACLPLTYRSGCLGNERVIRPKYHIVGLVNPAPVTRPVLYAHIGGICIGRGLAPAFLISAEGHAHALV